MEPAKVEEYTDVTEESFITDIYPRRKPAVLKGVDIGPCISKWTVEYLCEYGGKNDVKIHVSATPQMDFISKNFVYRTLPFNEFVRRASEDIKKEFFLNEDEKYYLRALGDDPRKDIADIHTQFPVLACDINIPEYFTPDRFFSSVFRIGSAGVQLWTHYDVMDNLLVQVTGRKRVVLFSPEDVDKLYLKGDKSLVLDIDHPDEDKYPLFRQARRYECRLSPGDILFIPALWFHSVVSLDFGVAVNVFWRHLDLEIYDPRDTYGNRDPIPAARAQQIVDRAVKVLEELPQEYRDFYARCLAARLLDKTVNKAEDSS
ncbi:tRNA wybutosine-synthesizing protein 5-like [Liolophura sinensis]|uniref:tRNA wybutosine-synthesizing protein 5-like n=1 Tax=Liolophura sinensis TaxID=3198878 RepID=UPI0031590E3C